MSHVYFLSYASCRDHQSDEVGLLDEFDRDLRIRVEEHLQLRNSFRCTRSIEPGSPSWRDSLIDALSQTAIGVILTSPAYFDVGRPVCKWEFQCLVQRGKSGVTDSKRLPVRLMLMLPWITMRDEYYPRDFPKEMQRLNESIAADDGETEAIRQINRRGILATLRLKAGGSDKDATYLKALDAISRFIVEQYRRLPERFLDLLNAAPLPAYDENDRWQSALQVANCKSPPLGRALNPPKAIIVFLAATPGAKPIANERQWRYEEDGESDWRPFVAEGALDKTLKNHKIGNIVRNIEDVEIERVHFDFFSDNFKRFVELFYEKYPIILAIDPWSLTEFKNYPEALARLEEHGAYESPVACPIVIWSEVDPAAQARREGFNNLAGIVIGNAWEQVKDEEDFVACLKQSIQRLNRKIRNLRADRSSHGGSSLPTINPRPQ